MKRIKIRFDSLPNSQFTPGWGNMLKNRLKSKFRKVDKINEYEKKINSLKCINGRVYNEMIDNITKTVPKKKKEQWEIDIEEDIRKLDEDEVQITKLRKAFKGYAESYEITIIDNKDPLIQLNNTRSQINNHLES